MRRRDGTGMQTAREKDRQSQSELGQSAGGGAPRREGSLVARTLGKAPPSRCCFLALKVWEYLKTFSNLAPSSGCRLPLPWLP